MLHGYDISNHNYQFVSQAPLTVRGGDFVWCKATEGVTFVDRTFKSYMAIYDNMVRGAYHYARPENNSAKDEANHFLDTIWDVLEKGPMLLALDWEGRALDYPESWILEWMKTVEERVDGKPIIYIQASALSAIPNVIAADYGLWIAEWNNKLSPSYKGLWAFHQYSNSPLDINSFNGNMEQLEKYTCTIKGGNAPSEPHCCGNCSCCTMSKCER